MLSFEYSNTKHATKKKKATYTYMYIEDFRKQDGEIQNKSNTSDLN